MLVPDSKYSSFKDHIIKANIKNAKKKTHKSSNVYIILLIYTIHKKVDQTLALPAISVTIILLLVQAKICLGPSSIAEDFWEIEIQYFEKKISWL